MQRLIFVFALILSACGDVGGGTNTDATSKPESDMDLVCRSEVWYFFCASNVVRRI